MQTVIYNGRSSVADFLNEWVVAILKCYKSIKTIIIKTTIIMNTIIKTTITFLATVLFAISCSKKDDAPAASEEGTGTFTCKIDGVPFTAASASGGDNAALRLTAINARFADGNTMIFSLKEAIAKVGTITCDGTNGSLVNYGKDTNYSFPDMGSINITTFTSTRAKGTFNFTLRNTPSDKKVITEGTFDVPLQNGF